jgi:ABC-type Fe3+ transport system substrate-binding protein
MTSDFGLWRDGLAALGRRRLLQGAAGAALATPFLHRTAQAAQVVNVLGVPGLHVKLWQEWTSMVREDTKGEVEVRFDPLGYAPAFAKIKTEAESRSFGTDLFYGDSPFPERLALDGLVERLPYDDLPHTKELEPFARGEFTLEVFRTNWGVAAFNTNFVRANTFQTPLSWEVFADPRWKNRLSWADPRGFPVWIPIVVELFGENGWIDYCRRIDANVKTYHARWIDNRIGLQRGDAWITMMNLGNIYISTQIDKASVSGFPITQPEVGLGVLPVSIALLKNAPSRTGAMKVLDLISSARYAKVMMDIGLNPSNNPSNYPHPLSDKTLELNNGKQVGLNSWADVQKHTMNTNWVEWAGKMDRYVQTWEAEILRRRG